ncbi:hypothetical protein WR25_00272 [Diploscapter pachys]|uniref:Uncharacterized protein n=1 Tax=Diploscapter pachys TaxID=2018661 RepID=A0A2A2J4U4_9BILA|nr:hypothetical protein WR25_00272 [Diploscapter pachys]
MFQVEFLVSPTPSRGPHQKVDARFRDPVIDIEPARDLIRYIKNFTFESNAEVLVNVAITVTVIGFIAYQALSLVYPSGSGRVARFQSMKNDKNKKETVDREVSENLHLDLHEHVVEKQIPFRTIKMSEEDTIKKSQLFYEQMKLRRHGASWVVDVSQLQDTWLRPYITDAPYLIVICYEIFKIGSNGEQERMMHINEISTAISIGVLLAALQVLLLLPVGYPAEDAQVPDLKRKPIEDITQLY